MQAVALLEIHRKFHGKVREFRFQNSQYRGFYGALVDDPQMVAQRTAVHAVRHDPHLTAQLSFMSFDTNELPDYSKWWHVKVDRTNVDDYQEIDL
jgi:hypothetical protein